MRAWLVVMVSIGCKSEPAPPLIPQDAPADAVAIDEAPPAPDAPVLACDPTVVAGTTISVRALVPDIGGEAVLATSPPGDRRLFVVDRIGKVRIIAPTGQLIATPFLDISNAAGGPVDASATEMGLLGLAFHPRYATNHQLFVFFTEVRPAPGTSYTNVVMRYTTSATDPDVVDLASATTILSLPDYATNHNGGMLEFGADGMLYIGTGDGGGSGDPQRNGQNTQRLLGKMLRIDVDHPANGKPYGIPADNPFADGVAGAPEVWMYGLRNPWRWSFDRATGDMWIGDVGQGQNEEIDVARAGEQAGKNFGWSVYEGTTCCQDTVDDCRQTPASQAPCVATGMTPPLDQRTHADGWFAIIGGQVYRGSKYPDLAGWYFYTDHTRHRLVKARLLPAGTLEIVDLPVPTGGWPIQPTSIHADACGELMMTTGRGAVYAIEAGP